MSAFSWIGDRYDEVIADAKNNPVKTALKVSANVAVCFVPGGLAVRATACAVSALVVTTESCMSESNRKDAYDDGYTDGTDDEKLRAGKLDSCCFAYVKKFMERFSDTTDMHITLVCGSLSILSVDNLTRKNISLLLNKANDKASCPDSFLVALKTEIKNFNK